MGRGLLREAAFLSLILVSGCGGPGGAGEDRPVGKLFDQIALKFVQYNDALVRQDDLGCVALGMEIRQLVQDRFDEVAAGLSSEDTRVQCDAAFALGFSRKREAIPLLVRATESPLVPLRVNAAAALGMLAMEEVPVEPFLKLLQDPHPRVRAAALVGIRFLLEEERDRGLLERIHGMLSDPAMEVRNEALVVLRKLKRKESVERILAQGVKDPDPLVRSNAAAALGAMGLKAYEATPVLIEMLRDEVPKVVESAWVALRAIHQKELDRSYGSWRGWYEEELQHLYVCPRHREETQPFSGECRRCGTRLERLPLEVVRKLPGPAGLFSCPDHPEVVTATAGQCGKCGKDLVPRRTEPTRYVCPDHPEVQTLTPGQCGKPGCGKDLRPMK